MTKLSSQFEKGSDGEIAAWSWLQENLKRCGLSDTMSEWSLEIQEFDGKKCRYIFTR